jgi:hypothetical protein
VWCVVRGGLGRGGGPPSPPPCPPPPLRWRTLLTHATHSTHTPSRIHTLFLWRDAPAPPPAATPSRLQSLLLKRLREEYGVEPAQVLFFDGGCPPLTVMSGRELLRPARQIALCMRCLFVLSLPSSPPRLPSRVHLPADDFANVEHAEGEGYMSHYTPLGFDRSVWLAVMRSLCESSE